MGLSQSYRAIAPNHDIGWSLVTSLAGAWGNSVGQRRASCCSIQVRWVAFLSMLLAHSILALSTRDHTKSCSTHPEVLETAIIALEDHPTVIKSRNWLVSGGYILLYVYPRCKWEDADPITACVGGCLHILKLEEAQAELQFWLRRDGCGVVTNRWCPIS